MDRAAACRDVPDRAGIHMSETRRLVEWRAVDVPPIRLPAGVRDFLPEAAARRRALAERVLAVFEAWGYARIITPMFEVADVLERGLGADARAAAIRFVEPGTGEVVALRPDITPQVARLAATRMRDARGPLRLCYEGAVTRLAGAAGQREILQAGIELIDPTPAAKKQDPSIAADAEVLAVAGAALGAAGLREVRLDVGHVAPVAHVLAAAGDAAPRVRAALARKDRAAVAAIARALAWPAETGELAVALVGLWGAADDVLARARGLAWPAPVRAALDRVDAAIAGARALAAGARPVAITLDLGEVRGFDYYTGLRVAGYAAGAADAVLRGGRYDELLARYGAPARATGFAIDIEALAEADHDTATAPASAPGVLVAGGDGQAPAIAAALRKKGARVAVDLAPRTAGALRAYLAGSGYDVAVVIEGRAARAIAARGPRTGAAAISAKAIALAARGDGAPLMRALGFS
jgi:ATP phosphoribosyltransferase regulatory subunit